MKTFSRRRPRDKKKKKKLREGRHTSKAGRAE